MQRGYFQSSIYEILLWDAYRIVGSCSACGCQSVYCCTEKVRLNASRRQVDIWLVYQCETCKHTYNVLLYTRVSSKELDINLHETLQRNDRPLVAAYAMVGRFCKGGE